MTKTRLTQQDWIDAGFLALKAQGPAALKAEPLARALNTTKGSFYWHFRDVPAFQNQMLTHWEEAALTGLIAEIEEQNTAHTALQKFVHLVADPQGATTAVRAWAQSDPSVANALAEIDNARLKYLAALLKRAGVSNPDIAKALYAAAIGAQILPQTEAGATQASLDTMIDLILALR
ncbi:TetR/AcrR family transcriptional regulator [Lentibacter sp.]|uniref:TetR/AcrR family transcriptional regulator n=1 Tax=Lentibacter sp. TaxID=2024994 RepID=UPI003F6996BC